jgi:glyoxylase-like metal-dependent hydrolase (beta-lactamase superfamily II)
MTDVAALEDASGTFATFRQAFGVDDDADWRLGFYAFLVRLADAVVLVDTGVGPPDEDPFLPERQGRLPDELGRRGIAREDVDLVVLTHLHVDHVGWNVLDGEPFFPNARYVAHAADFDWFTGRTPDRQYVREQLLGLRETGRLELVSESCSPHPGIALRHEPGHTPGHCVVDLGDVLLLGDTAVHELQLADPDLAYASEVDAPAAAAVRRRLLPEVAERGVVVGLGHLPGGLGRIRREGDGFAWQSLD